MSTITEILNTDSPSSSLGAINDNFEALNTDKIEATQTVALTNKTIDADLNTITDLTPTNIKSANKTGLDTKVVTGTDGDANDLIMWNSDGDAVSSGYTVAEIISEAVTEAEASLTTKELFVSCIKSSDTMPYTPSAIGNFAFAQLDSGEVGYFHFRCPQNFNTLDAVYLVMIPDATETLTMTDCSVSLIAEGEVYTGTVTATGSNTKSVTVNQMTYWRLDNLTNTPFALMQPSDMVAVAITSGTTMMRVLGLSVIYS